MRVRPLHVLFTFTSLTALVAACESGNDDVGTVPASSVADGGSDAARGSSVDGGTTGVSGDDGDDSGVVVGDGDGGETSDATVHGDAGTPGDASDDGDGSANGGQLLVTTLGAGLHAEVSRINQGTAIGGGASNGATPSTLTNVAADPNNTQSITSSMNPFGAVGHVPDTAAGFCDYSGASPKRISYVTGQKFETDGGADPLVPMAPFYFPLVYTSAVTTSGNAFGGKAPILGLFDWRPKDIDEAVVVAESDDQGQTWYFMQTAFELNPDLTNPNSGGYTSSATSTGCPKTLQSTNDKVKSADGSTGDDGWGHAAIVQLPGAGNAGTSQFLYLLDRNPSVVDQAQLRVVQLVKATPKFPLWNTNDTSVGHDDVKSIESALDGTPDAGTPVNVQSTVGLLNPDGILGVFPTAADAPVGSPVTVLYVQKIVGADNSGSTALPAAQQCQPAPVSGDTNHDIAYVRLASTTDGIHFTDLGAVSGLSDPTTVDYTETRWVSPRGTLIDVNGDGSTWGLYFAGGNCLDGDSDAFHFIGYAESTDKVHWHVWNDMSSPIASINTVTAKNQATGATVTVPANAPVIPTESWFAERLYAPSAVQVDATHLAMTFAGYGVQTPGNDLLDYRQIGHVTLTVSRALPSGTPNNVNAH